MTATGVVTAGAVDETMAVVVTSVTGETEDVLTSEGDAELDEEIEAELKTELDSPMLVAMLSVSELEERTDVTSVVWRVVWDTSGVVTNEGVVEASGV